jgi:hypothetical protein
MHNRLKIVCFIVVTLACYSSAANAQWVVHALGGTVKLVNPSAKSIILVTDDGSSGLFQLPPKSDVNLTFDKDVRAETTASEKFTGNIGTHVILYFFGEDNTRTTVAVHSLGSGPFEKVTGTVLKFSKHDHVITLQTKAGKTETIVVSDKTVVDTSDGVAQGRRFRAEKGDHLRLLTDSKNGIQEALLIRTSGIDSTAW